MADIKVPTTIELRAGDVVVAVIENNHALWNHVLGYAVAADQKAKTEPAEPPGGGE